MYKNISGYIKRIGMQFEDECGKISLKILDEKNCDEITIRYWRGSCWKSCEQRNRRLG